MKQYQGYQPPRSFSFDSTAMAILHYVVAVSSVEANRFVDYLKIHPVTVDNDHKMSKFLSAYSLVEWTKGQIAPVCWKGKELGARDSLIRWAKAMIEFNTYWRNSNLQDPIATFSKIGIISLDEQEHWKINFDLLQKHLGIDLSKSKFYQSMIESQRDAHE